MEGWVRSRIEALLGSEAVAWDPRPGGLTAARTGVARLADGRQAFVKLATDAVSAGEVAAEARFLGAVQARFVPRLLAAHVGGAEPGLAVEDLSHAAWPEPYPEDLGPLLDALETLRSLPPPPGAGLRPLPAGPPRAPLESAAGQALPPGVTAWVRRHAASLRRAATTAVAGGAVAHGDLWYSNLCFLPGRAVLVDWSHAGIGSPWQDAATVSIDLVLGGRAPLPMGEGATWAARWVAHALAGLSRGPRPEYPSPSAWRLDLEELFDGAAWWFAHEVGVAPPTPLTHRSHGPP